MKLVPIIFFASISLRTVTANYFGFEICGTPADECMTEEIWTDCLDMIVRGCQDLKVDETSCPKTFSCANELKVVSFPDKEKEEDPSACVSLLLYGDPKCHGDPVRSITFPTWTKPGSPCYHDATMPNYSVKDQYCDLEEGTWHETQVRS